MHDLKVALIQAKLVWENPEANLRNFKQRIKQVEPGVHLIVLPEMFSTGFSMAPARLAKQMGGRAISWMKTRSKESEADIVGSLMVEEDGHFYNRLIWVKPDGIVYRYDKKHLFRHAGEEKVYTPGDGQLLVTCHGWKIRPFICYDLRFPIWTRNLDNAYDAAIFVANWPERRAPHWNVLLRARAIENQCYVAGVNRVGKDGNGLRYSGDSCIIDPMGRLVAGMRHKETTITANFSAEILNGYRKDFPAWMDADFRMITG